MPAEPPEPIRLPESLWRRHDVVDMCRRRDAASLLRLANSSKYRVSQGRLASWIGSETGEVNKLINGKAGQVLRLDRWERIADALNMPDHARVTLGLAPRQADLTLSAGVSPSDRPGQPLRSDVDRRELLVNAALLGAASALSAAPLPVSGGSRVGRADVEAVREMVTLFSRSDQRRGGGHGRSAVAHYLTSEVVGGYLRGRFADDRLRGAMFGAAGELAYLVGWMAFDDADHAIARQSFALALDLADEGDDPALSGHILRAMAHQSIDVGRLDQATTFASLSVDSRRRSSASSRERALIGVVHARSLAAVGDKKGAAAALVLAEDDLAAARAGDGEPDRVFFFGEASLAHETACALRDMGDTDGAVREFSRSVRTRQSARFTRTHAITLGYLGAVQAQSSGGIEEACATWSLALDSMDGVRSGRARQVAAGMRSALGPLRGRRIAGVDEVDDRAARYLGAAA